MRSNTTSRNLTRIDNALSQMPQRLESVKVQLDNLYQQQAAAKEEVGKAFPYEEELRVKNRRFWISPRRWLMCTAILKSWKPAIWM
ncbi:hypothetical protein AALD01_17880 [Oscillospiraceae bacterium 21-37]